MPDTLKDTLNRTIILCEEAYRILEENKLLDTQEALDWFDRLNDISVRH